MKSLLPTTFLLFLIAFWGCDSNTGLPTPNPGQTNVLAEGIEHELESFKLTVPSDWTRKAEAIVAFHASPIDSTLYPNFKVAKLKLPDGLGMMDSVNQSKERWASIWSVSEESKTSTNGTPGYRLVVTQDIGVTKSKMLKQFIQYDKVLLIATAQCEAEKFEENTSIFQAIIDSIECLD